MGEIIEFEEYEKILKRAIKISQSDDPDDKIEFEALANALTEFEVLHRKH